MKTRNTLPLFYALSFLILSVGSVSAQLKPLYPYNVQLSLDTAFITQDFNQQPTTPYKIKGTIQEMGGVGADHVTINITNAKQWVITTKINGSSVQDGDIFNVAPNQTLPVEITISPYAEVPDTEHYCIELSLSPTYILSQDCITLVLTNTKAAVSSILPMPNISIVPNPAENYINVHGLDNMQTGYRYEIFSISGAEVRHGMLPVDGHLNIQDISSGAYRILLFNTKGMLANPAFTVVH